MKEACAVLDARHMLAEETRLLEEETHKELTNTQKHLQWSMCNNNLVGTISYTSRRINRVQATTVT